MNCLVDIDNALLRLLNQQWTSLFLDSVIPIFSHFDQWKIPLIAILIFIAIRERLRGVLIVVGLGLTILLSEAMCSLVVKEVIDRVRPCHIHTWVRLIEGYCPKSPSFPSSHATNITAAVTYLSFFFPRWLFAMVPVALLVGYSRVYLGVHYPLDVVGGAILGAGCGWAVFVVFKRLVFSRLRTELQPANTRAYKRSAKKKR